MTSYIPACKVRLRIRLEDTSSGPLPPALRPAPVGGGPESFGSGGLDDPSYVDDEFAISRDIVPTSCVVELNNYRKADSAKIEFPLALLPILPSLVRAISVQVFAGTASPLEYIDAATGGWILPDVPTPETGEPTSFGGVTNEVFRGFADRHAIKIDEDNQTVEIEARDLTGELLDAEIPPNQLRDLPGYLRLDEAIQLLLTGDGLAEEQQDQRRFEEEQAKIGRDYRALLGLRRIQENAAADALADADAAAYAEALGRIADLDVQAQAVQAQAQAIPPVTRRFGLPGFRGIEVVNEVTAPGVPDLILDLPTIEELRPKQWVDSRKTAKKGRKKGVGNAQKVAYWDFIWELVGGAGYICFIRVPTGSGDLPPAELVITNPRTYYAQAEIAGDAQPADVDIREFILGVNIETLSMSRSLKGMKVPTVMVRAFDATTGERYSGIYPPLGKNNRPTPTGDGDRDEIKLFTMDQIAGGSPDEIRAALNRAAASIYEQLGRGDLELDVTTKHLSARRENMAKGIKSDLFALRPKDPIRITLPVADPVTGLVSSSMVLDNADEATLIRHARRAGLDEAAARKLAAVTASQYVQREYRTKQITMTWGDGGWEIAVNGINYLDVRDSVQVNDAQA